MVQAASRSVSVGHHPDFDAWLGHAVQGRSKRHQLWLGRPGKGKTARLHRHIENTVGQRMFPHLKGRVAGPIYSGRITPAKWFIQGWQHRLEPLLCLNDVAIRRVDTDWESMLCQFLEVAGPRTRRWDLKSRATLEPEDRRDIVRYLRQKGLIDQFLQEQREQSEEKWEDEPWPYDRRERSPSRRSVLEHDDFERSMDEIEGEEDQPNPIDGAAERHLLLPPAYDTATTVILVANNLGDEGWERISSRLKVFIWDPFPEEQIADLRTWDPPVPGAILGVIESCHRKGEVLNLDYRAVLEAIDALALGMPWEDALRASFFSPSDQQVQEDANDTMDWLVRKGAKADQTFTERDLYQEVGSLRGERNKPRRSAALDFLIAQGWIERFLPPAVLQPGRRGRRPGMTFTSSGSRRTDLCTQCTKCT